MVAGISKGYQKLLSLDRYDYIEVCDVYFGCFKLTRTSIKVSDNTHKTVIQTKGIFEQLFRRNLSLDDTIYLSTRLISSVYENVQKFVALGKVTIQQSEDGSIQIVGFENIYSELLPELVKEFTEINDKLAEKEKRLQLAMTR